MRYVTNRWTKWMAAWLTVLMATLPLLQELPFVEAQTSDFAGGTGQLGSPYQIATAEQLDKVREHPDKHFILVADIDLSGKSWEPIGSSTTPFTGSFDGDKYMISGLTINKPSTDDVGLFGFTGSTAKITNVTLANVNIRGKENVGALVGHNEGTIENSLVTGTGIVKGHMVVGGLIGINSRTVENVYAAVTVEGDAFVGGLVGQNSGGVIENALATGKVTGIGTVGGRVGGLVGMNRDNGKIQNAAATGDVEGTQYDGAWAGGIGGLVGENLDSQITDAYATGTVIGMNYDNRFSNRGRSVGGLVGQNDAGSIKDSYATGTVIGGAQVGGLVGDNHYATIENSYAIGDVVAYKYTVGGLVGWNNYGLIKNVYATGNVEEQLHGFLYYGSAGGLVGSNDSGEISNAYATGTVTGYYVGGIAGSMDDWGSTEPEIKNSVALNSEISSVSSKIGRIIGLKWAGKTSNNYALVTMRVNGTSISDDVKNNDENGADIGETAAKTQSTYEGMGWDFNNIWQMNPGEYPTLRKGTKYALSLKSNPDQGGITMGFGLYNLGEQANLIAIENPGYRFVNWTMDGVIVNEDDAFNYVMPAENVMIVANFEKKSYDLTVKANDAKAGQVKGSGTYEFESIVQLEASAKDGYEFVNWTIDGEEVSQEATFEYTIPAHDVTIVANFKKKSFHLTVDANNPKAGQVTGSGTYEFESVVQLEARANPGYRFVNWTIDGVEVSKEAIFEYTIPAHDVTIVANFASIPAASTVVMDALARVDNGEVMKIPFTRTRDVDGKVTDDLTLTPQQGAELAQRLSQGGHKTVQIEIPDETGEVSQTHITLSREALQALAAARVNLQLVTASGSLFIPYEQLAGLDQDLTIRIVPLKDGQASQEILERASQSVLVQQLATGQKVQLVGQPVIIETNLQNRPVTVILPLNSTASGNEGGSDWLRDLLIYIQHSDGQEEWVYPEVVEQGERQRGLQFGVEHFSTFAILHVEGWREGTHHRSYIKGYADGTFKPEHLVTRAQVATMLSRLLGYDKGQKASDAHFIDVPVDHWASGAIAFVKERGLMVGNQEGRFKPETPITRAEMAVIAARYKQLPLPTQQESITAFIDIASHWAAREIAAVKAAGIVDGYADGTYLPDNPLKRSQAVKILNRLLGRGPLHNVPGATFSDVQEGYWAYREIEEAARTHHFLPHSHGGERYVKQ